MERLIGLPLFYLSDPVVIGLSVVGWVAWSFVIGYLGHRLPLSLLERDTCLTQPRIWGEERNGYEHHLRIRCWKDRLPEAGDFFPGGFRKSAIGGKDSASMARFLAETRRAEYVHMAIWPFWMATMLWTPGWGILINLAVGTALNLPCIWVQRYNRMRIQHVLQQREQRQSHP
jgi:glycosyl-4,4'-diaponeurosporenoate acyltransferase